MSPPVRVFIGWNAPILPRVAAWLLEGGADALAETVVVVPGRRSGRLLLSYLVARVERSADATRELVPPRILTPGALPELFYRPPRAIASRRERVLAWCEALGPADDASARIAFARDLVRCQDDLAEEGLRLSDVPERAAAALGAGGEIERWRSFASLEHAELAILERGGRVDPTAARLAVLARDHGESGPPVVLCAVAALRGLERQFLERFAPLVTSLVAAPESEAALFDLWGSVDVGAWRKRQVTVPSESLSLVGRPRSQALAVAVQVETALGERGPRASEGGRSGNGSE